MRDDSPMDMANARQMHADAMELKRLRAQIGEMERERGEANAALRAELDNNTRLRALIKSQESAANGRCPWCASVRRLMSPRFADVVIQPHTLASDPVPHPDLQHIDCPAFTPEGEVK